MQPSRRQLLSLMFGAIFLTLAGTSATAADWPTRHVQLMVPYPPGGGVDFTARVLADALGSVLGKPVIVENRAGAAGTIGVNRLAQSDPDGHQLAIVSPGPTTIGPILQPTPYDPLSLTYITRVTTAPMLLIARKDFPAQDLKGLLAYTKANPGAVRFANAGQGTATHLAAELLSLRLKTPMIQVPYRGTAPALTDVMSGQVDVFFSDVSAIGNVEQGQVRLLAVSTAKRWHRAPNVPAVIEELPEFAVDSWYGLIGPPRMPEAIRNQVEAAFIRALTTPAVRQKLLGGGLDASPMPSPEFTAFIRKEIGIWRNVISNAKISVKN